MTSILVVAAKAITGVLGVLSTLNVASTWWIHQPKAPKSVVK